jgi:hypothetical protein
VLNVGLTANIFEVFMCRELGFNDSVLHIDYTVDCEATSALRWAIGGVLVLLWPVGLPALLFTAMYRVRAKIHDDDEDTLLIFAFVLGDYDTAHWYWEVVELGRKLILAGFIGLVRARPPSPPSPEQLAPQLRRL